MTREAKALAILWLAIGAMLALLYLLPSEVVVTADGEVTFGEVVETEERELGCYTYLVDGKTHVECTDLGPMESAP